MSDQLKATGEIIRDSLNISVILNSLPKTYDNCVFTLMGKEKLDVEGAIDYLLKSNTRDTEDEISQGLSVLQINRKVKCEFCHKQDHKKEICRHFLKLKEEEEGQAKASHSYHQKKMFKTDKK